MTIDSETETGTREQFKVYNHVAPTVSELDMQVIKSVPPGGNWEDIPLSVAEKSKRIMQIRKSGGRTTYYGRLRNDLPSYTVSTYFHRPGNGSFVHPKQDRMISVREAARLQSFFDDHRFLGPASSQYKQVGNAVPPLLGRAVGVTIPSGFAVDLFCGAGGLSHGLRLAGHTTVVASDIDPTMCETYSRNHPESITLRADLSDSQEYAALVSQVDERLGSKSPNLLVGGPPCQGFSTAGKWNLSDTRNNLVSIMLKAIEDLTPHYFIMENVTGLSWIGKGKVLEELVERMSTLGYLTECFTLKAEQFGVPQRRRRIFIVGSSTARSRPPKPTPSFSAVKTGGRRSHPEYEQPSLAQPVSVSEAISDLPPLVSGEGQEVFEQVAREPESEYQEAMRGLRSVRSFLEARADPSLWSKDIWS
jgi:DNA (cytosine-5)-methyltransferase 1